MAQPYEPLALYLSNQGPQILYTKIRLDIIYENSCPHFKEAAIKTLVSSVTRKKSPNVYKSCQKMISLEKWLILTPLQKLPKNGGYLDNLIVAKGFKKLPKVQ